MTVYAQNTSLSTLLPLSLQVGAHARGYMGGGAGRGELSLMEGNRKCPLTPAREAACSVHISTQTGETLTKKLIFGLKQ